MSGEGREPRRLGLVAPLSLAGKELRRLLPESGLALGEVVLLDRDEGGGVLTEYAGEAAVVQRLGGEGLAGLDAVVFCAGGDLLERVAPLPDGPGPRVLDLTGTLPLGRARLVVAGLNEAAAREARLVRAAHPAAALLARLLVALRATAPALRADAVVYEPVAARGEAGLDELHRQTVEVLSFRPPPTEALGARLAFNLLPRWDEAGRAEAARVREELRLLLAPSPPAVGVSIVRAPVFLGCAVALELELEQEEDAAAVAEGLAETAGVVVLAEPASPGDLPDDDDAAPIWVSVAPADEPGRVRLWAVADSVRRGAASALDVLAQMLA